MSDQPRKPDLSALTASLSDVISKMPVIPKFSLPDIRMPEIGPSPLITNIDANMASEFHKKLAKWIADFDDRLDDKHEVGVRLVSFGQTIVFRLEGMGYWNPSLIVFTGRTDDNQPVELIQHVSQISILLMKLAREDPSEPKPRIGFRAIDGE